jgi:hypothetical protein
MVYSFSSPLAPGPIRVAIRPGSSALAVGEEIGFSFDGEGRLLTASEGPVVYKRGLNHHIVAKRRIDGQRATRPLEEPDAAGLIDRVEATLAFVLRVLPPDAPAEARLRIEEASTWTNARYEGDRALYDSLYSPVGILPPDQYMSLVAQATEGCHYNRCTFCTFYREIPFRTKTVEEFSRHIAAVRTYIGRGLPLRRSIFLADANALVVSHRRLLGFFDALSDVFEIAPAHLSRPERAAWRRDHPDGIDGIYSFMDAFTGDGIPTEEMSQFAERGLRRVYVGMESGHIPLLSFLQKPSMPEDVLEAVIRTRAAGVGVGIIVMTGVGGRLYAEGHVTDTVALLNRLPLGPGDLIYLSPFRQDSESPYTGLARRMGLQPLTEEEGIAQAEAIRRGVRLNPGVQVSVYDLEEFIY